MNKQKIIIVLFIMLGLVSGILIHAQNSNQKKLNKLKLQIDNIEERIVSDTIHFILDDPSNFFLLLDIYPEWKEIEAIPYSKCYKHLTGTTTADYIFCKAI